MSATTDDPTPPPTPPTSPAPPPATVVVDRGAETRVERRGRLVAFLAGFATAVVLGVVGIVTFLAVSDSDDDGTVELEVPSVDVDVDG